MYVEVRQTKEGRNKCKSVRVQWQRQQQNGNKLKYSINKIYKIVIAVNDNVDVVVEKEVRKKKK